jgi:parvulin-like peptidyl-prolyl isomerase
MAAKGPSTLPATMPSTQPIENAQQTGSTPTTLPTGQYMVVGLVVAEVDGQPIFANKVLALSQKELSVQAKELDERAFRRLAMDQIDKDKNQLIRDELEYRAAQRSLSEDERKLARTLTTKWLNDAIAHAGGSEEQLKRRVAAEGYNYDDVLNDKHREFMTQVYYQRKVIPLIVITADGMREYYEKHKADFSEKSGVSFRMIKVSVKEVGDRERALSIAQEIQDAAASNPDGFAALAKERNKEAYLKTSGGLPMDGLIEKGAFAIKPVEDAAWALEPGQVSPVITVGDAFYIIKLEKKTTGRTEPFTSEQVQDRIRAALRSEQFKALRDKEQKKLESEAIINIKRNALDTTLDMVMQRYKVWKGQ